ncbi:hypothetical protein VV02_25340 [Luteipulveratus mongoliensis]|uniref:Polymerase nucleotidyl transferase domain-containing protein n=1 Tax=Luteipulveratus mongoliensis TaxID=571913 RepID=A0A0K1JRG9_9MICO|nr:hypothetical protein VV02_25340 [Luteipulveratus mongoliensis]
MKIEDRRLPGPLEGKLGRRIQDHRAEILGVAASYGITNLRVFGSVARGEETDASDIDFIARLPDGLGLIGLARVQQDLQRIVDAPVDLVPEGSLKRAIRTRVDHEALPI